MDEYISKHEAYTKLKDLEAAYIYPPVKEAYATAARRVDEIKVADVQPMKHGRWIDIYEWAKMHDSTPSGMCTYYWCSECQTEQEKKSNFCPNCGAKMIEKPNLQLLKDAVELIKKAKEIKVDEARMDGDAK